MAKACKPPLPPKFALCTFTFTYFFPRGTLPLLLSDKGWRGRETEAWPTAPWSSEGPAAKPISLEAPLCRSPARSLQPAASRPTTAPGWSGRGQKEEPCAPCWITEARPHRRGGRERHRRGPGEGSRAALGSLVRRCICSAPVTLLFPHFARAAPGPAETSAIHLLEGVWDCDSLGSEAPVERWGSSRPCQFLLEGQGHRCSFLHPLIHPAVLITTYGAPTVGPTQFWAQGSKGGQDVVDL